MGALYRTALVLVIVGAINWGLIGFFRFDLVASIFGGQTAGLSRLIYALVGIAGIVCIPLLMKRLTEDEAENNPGSSQTRLHTKPNYHMEAGKEADFSQLERERRENGSKKN